MVMNGVGGNFFSIWMNNLRFMKSIKSERESPSIFSFIAVPKLGWHELWFSVYFSVYFRLDLRTFSPTTSNRMDLMILSKLSAKDQRFSTKRITFRHRNDDYGRYYHSAKGYPNKIVRGRYGSRDPATGRVEEVKYTSGPRGWVKNHLHHKVEGLCMKIWCSFMRRNNV